jgi:uncharacterized protein with PIN domain
MINLTEEQIERILAERKAQQAQREADDQALAAQKAQTEAAWAKLRNPEPFTNRSAHPCEKCKGVIAKGDQAKKRTVIVNVSKFGWTPQPRTLYRHLECSKQ